MEKPEEIDVDVNNNYLCFVLGIVFLILKRIKHFFQGYTSPAPFSIEKMDKSIEYDIDVIESWLNRLREYKGRDYKIKGKKTLELGPGNDLGTGVLLLQKGAENYKAMDVYNLVKRTPQKFYKRLIKKVDASKNTSTPKINNILDNIDFKYNKKFDLSVFEKNSVDVVFSQAAFEHFDNVKETTSQLDDVVRPGGVLIAEVDLQTHGHPIRDWDPLNIYRYPENLYDLLKAKSFHNRLHIDDYKKILKNEGWKNVEIRPIKTVDKKYYNHIKSHLDPKYQRYEEKMKALSIVVCATKK